MSLRNETRCKLEVLMCKPMDPANIRELDAFFDDLPPLERAEAANYGTEIANRNLNATLKKQPGAF